MKIVSTSYSKTESFSDPQEWLQRIDFYTGILKELAKANDVTSIERISYEGELKEDGVCYRFIGLKKKVVRFPWRMHRSIKGLKPDVVLVNGLGFPLQVIQLRWTLGKNVKIILLHRAEKPATGIKKYFQQLADKYVDAYLFTSEGFGEEWKNIINARKIHEVAQASSVFEQGDKRLAREQLKLEGSPVFLWAGRLDANKDPLTFVKAFLRFLPHQPSARSYMIFQTEELLNEIKVLIGQTDNIQLVGKVEHQQLQNWFTSADYIISGSHYESNGISVLEAMSCGCIPIVTDILSFRSMTGNGKFGMLYEPGNEKELLKILLATKEWDINAEAKKVVTHFNSEFSFEAIAKKMERVITSLNKIS